MSKFKVHDLDSAPEKSQESLKESKENAGSIPNLHGVLAESPGLLKAYKELHTLFSKSSFTAEEKTVVWMTISVEHGCTYCVPAHTMIANAMKVDSEITEALRNRDSMPTKKLQVLHDTTLKLIRSRGRISDQDMNTFFDSGYEQKHLLDIILGLSQKMISNYVNHMADTPLDDDFKEFAWQK